MRKIAAHRRLFVCILFRLAEVATVAIKERPMPVDIHAHYVPPQTLDAIATRGKDIGVALVKSGDAAPALHFAYGFKVRPFFPRLVEPVQQRHVWLDEQGIDLQVVGTWPDIF